MNAMRYFKQDQNWQPKDVHSGNVMARPSTGDFVIVDLGYFDFTRGAKNQNLNKATNYLLERYKK